MFLANKYSSHSFFVRKFQESTENMTQPELHVYPDIYNKRFPSFERPKIIGFIGLENLKFARDIRNRNVNFDLNLLIDKAIHRPQDLDVKLTELLKFLAEQSNLNLPLGHSLEHAPIFCYRGLMTCVACTPYENREPWKIVAILHKGNIYLCARDTEEKINKKLNMTEREKRCTSWGYKFEQFLLSDKPDLEPNSHLPVDENEEFSLVFTNRLNNHNIVYGAEMDGIICDKATTPSPDLESGTESIIQYLRSQKFVELKTDRHMEFPNQEKNFRRFKTRKWWCQSFLAGVETIVCGCRNDDGIVEELKTYSVRDLVKMSERFWNPNVCFNFLDTFFTYVKRCLAREIERKHGNKMLKNLQTVPMTCLLFEWRPGMPVQVTSHYSHEDDPILPEWFIGMDTD